MEVVRAYSGVVTGSQDWKKVEVSLNEEDLASLLDEAGIEVERKTIKTKHAYALLRAEAELLILDTMVQAFGISGGQVKDDAEKMKAQKALVLNRLRAQGGDNG